MNPTPVRQNPSTRAIVPTVDRLESLGRHLAEIGSPGEAASVRNLILDIRSGRRHLADAREVLRSRYWSMAVRRDRLFAEMDLVMNEVVRLSDAIDSIDVAPRP